jgi:long-chain acyl-CoA synthetase
LIEELYDVRRISDLRDMLAQSCKRFGENSAFLVKENSCYRGISYRAFGTEVSALGTVLISMGLKDGYVAVLSENRYEWCATYLSVANGVGVIVPIDKELPSEEIENLIRRCGAAAIIFSSKYRSLMKKIAGSIPEMRYLIDMELNQDEDGVLSYSCLIEKGRRLLARGDTRFIKSKIDPTELSVLIYTSGTTDLAKGVMLSHRNICTVLTAVCSTVHLDSDDIALSILPLHHTYECALGFLAIIYNGGTIAFCEGLRHIPANLKEVGPTYMVSVPLILDNIYKKINSHINESKILKIKFKTILVISRFLYKVFKVDIRKKVFKSVHDIFGGHIRLIITGAAAVKPEVSRFFRNMGISVLQGYGLTECAPLVTGNRDHAFVDGAVGLPIPGVSVRILEPDSRGIGEILVKGENVMLGYHKNEEATNKVLRDGWLYTGDLGCIDRNGFLYIAGRLKNVIITSNGKNIFPEEVETYLNRSPFVKESLVWGKYDGITGNILVCAQLLPNLDAIAEKLKGISASGQEIMKFMNEAVKNANMNMPIYKHIHQFVVRENEFVKTTTQKIKRYIETPLT